MKQTIMERLNYAYGGAKRVPNLFVVRDKDWDALLDSFTDSIKDMYKKHGFYTVTANSFGCMRLPKEVNGIPAISYKGVPVVKRTDYATIESKRSADMRKGTIKL